MLHSIHYVNIALVFARRWCAVGEPTERGAGGDLSEDNIKNRGASTLIGEISFETFNIRTTYDR